MPNAPFVRRRTSACRYPARHFAAHLFGRTCECMRECRQTAATSTKIKETSGILVALPSTLELKNEDSDVNTPSSSSSSPLPHLSNYHINKFGYYDCPAHQCLARFFWRSDLYTHVKEEHKNSSFFCPSHKILLKNVIEFNAHIDNCHSNR